MATADCDMKRCDMFQKTAKHSPSQPTLPTIHTTSPQSSPPSQYSIYSQANCLRGCLNPTFHQNPGRVPLMFRKGEDVHAWGGTDDVVLVDD
jgi:hypothetical protein